MFERIAILPRRLTPGRIENTYRKGERVDWRRTRTIQEHDRLHGRHDHEGSIDEEISRSSAKLGCPPRIVAIDYVQLVDGAGSRIPL